MLHLTVSTNFYVSIGKSQLKLRYAKRLTTIKDTSAFNIPPILVELYNLSPTSKRRQAQLPFQLGFPYSCMMVRSSKVNSPTEIQYTYNIATNVTTISSAIASLLYKSPYRGRACPSYHRVINLYFPTVDKTSEMIKEEIKVKILHNLSCQLKKLKMSLF